MPSAGDIVNFIICLCFSFALLAGLAFFFDKLLAPFIPKIQYITQLFFMLSRIILPLFGLLGIYHIFCTFITCFPKKVLLFRCKVLIIFLQIVFVDQIIPYNSQFNTKYLLLQYLYPLWRTYYST